MLWQDYLNRQQLKTQLTKNFPTRRPLDEVSPHRVFVKNTTAETIPSFACMQITGTEVAGNRTTLKVEKPTSTDGQYVFNCEYPIAVDGVGWAYRFGIVVMQGDAPSETGVEYSPIVGSWEIEEASGPFVVFGEYEIEGSAFTYTPLVIGRIGSTGGGGGETIWFTIDEMVCDPYGVEETYLLVTAEWYTGGCSKTPPGAEYGGQYKVYDICGYFGTPGDMEGTRGRATYMYPLTGYCEPRWIMDDACYEPSCI